MIRVDPSGFHEFPPPGDTKRQLLNHLIDPDESIAISTKVATVGVVDENSYVHERSYWMPDRLCKICYSCEESFTMYRRRHHCRVCGQVFCDRCCSYYIDGALVNLIGPVRACKFCADQLALRIDKEAKAGRKNFISSRSRNFVDELRSSNQQVYSHVSTIQESQQIRSEHTTSLQQCASAHLERLVERMLNTLDRDRDLWKGIVVNLVKEVVSTVDPNVRQGDSMDIRRYVKIKIIPGGSMEETVYVDGIVMRKTVAHKKMLSKGNIIRPRVLLIGGGIEFQRSDAKFSCLETLIEQEDKHLEILVEKILSLKPDVIILGRSISRKALELLVAQNVVALQNVKESQLDRIARLLGATVLPTTDHLVQQKGDECIGLCEKFSVRVVQDDPEKIRKPSKFECILKERICRGSSYVVLDGCPSELGCSVILRGACRETLREIKNILNFSIIVAYHLRLEVAYYNNRYAIVRKFPDDQQEFGDKHENRQRDCEDSDEEEWYDTYVKSIEGKAEHASEQVAADLVFPTMRSERSLLSTSLDIDVFLPYAEPIRGVQLADPRGYPTSESLAVDYQGISCTSIIIGKVDNVQKSKAEPRSMYFYDEGDTTLGKFLIDRCFRQKGKGKENLVGNTLIFVHRTGRLEFEISLMEGEHSNAIVGEDEDLLVDPIHLPIYTSSYCNLCENWVTPYEPLSEETWKISLGKFFEISFYNRSAKCRTGDCTHSLRDYHVTCFFCHTQEGRFQARVRFQPIHPFSLRVRKQLPLNVSFHNHETFKYLKSFGNESALILDDFKRILNVLQKDVEEILPSSADVYHMALTDILKIIAEVHLAQTEIDHTIELTLAELQSTTVATSEHKKNTSERSSVFHGDMIEATINHEGDSKYESLDEHDLKGNGQEESEVKEIGKSREGGRGIKEKQLRYSQTSRNFGEDEQGQELYEKTDDLERDKESTLSIEARFPMRFCRYLLSKAQDWNVAIDNWHRYLANCQRTQVPGSIVSPTEVERKLSGDNSTIEHESGSLGPLSEEIIETSISDAGPDTSNSITESSQENNSKELGASGSPRQDKARSSSDLEISDEVSSIVTDSNTVQLKIPPSFGVKDKDKRGSMFKTGRRLTAFFNKYAFKATSDESVKFNVPLNDLLRGRFTLKPGKEGEVIAVSEDEIASIISYSLASEEYQEKFLHEKGDLENLSTDVTYTKNDDLPDVSGYSEIPSGVISVGSVDSSTSTLLRNPSEHNDRGWSTDKIEHSISQNIQTVPGIVKVVKQSSEYTKYSRVAEKDSGRDKRLYFVQRMKSCKKIHVKHRFEDKDENDNINCKFICHTFWATQFHALRVCYLGDESDEGFIRSLALSASWNAQGGKSGAAFSKSLDGRFVVKCISRTELQMFLDISTEYFKYLADAYTDRKPTVLCKIMGIYQVGYHNKVTNKKIMEQVVVMENVFHDRNITRTFDLKGSSRARYTPTEHTEDFDSCLSKRREARKSGNWTLSPNVNDQVLMDDNLMELTRGLPFPLKHLGNTYLQKAIENDTEFLSSVNIVDYSILVGIDEDNFEVVVGIIDYLRQYDIIKRVERMGKSVGMIAGQAEPTIIQPSQYKRRFRLAMERNFMAVPDKFDF